MRRLLIIFLLAVSLFGFVTSCNQQTDEHNRLQGKLDSLEKKLGATYIPGTGEIMNGIIQPHHLKLWLAGQHKNWELAEYERHMLAGGFKRIRIYHKDQPEGTAVAMIDPAMSAIEKAIREKDANAFNKSYTLLTANCNTCHQALKNGFNVIAVPTAKAPVNQRF
jgi:hypothetical protein